MGRVRAAVKAARDGIKRERLGASQKRRQESDADTWERARTPWRNAEPTEALTWGEPLSGNGFVQKVADYGGYGPDKAILEIGPGYGRLLQAELDLGVPFASHTGVDLSAANVEHLTARFADAPARFHLVDAEQFELPDRFDTMISSLTLKHFYPSFEKALVNVVRHMNPGGKLIFDLVESSVVDRVLSGDAYFREETTFIRRYTRPQVEEILERVGVRLETFDEVQHAEEHRRLLVVASVPS